MQCVVIRGEQSSYKPISAGVPQGSVLGPTLFLVYINDIANNIESVIKMFADDTSLSLSEQYPDVRADILSSDLERVEVWAKNWKVRFNETKTDLLTTKYGPAPAYDLVFGNHTLEEKVSHKHLGIHIQNDCRWEEHTQYLFGKISPLVNCLRSFKYTLSRKSLEVMYTSFILPIFDYADIIWDGCTELQANRLESLHLDALRTIIGAVRGTSHDKIYQESGFCALKERRRRHKILQYFKILHGLCPNYLSSILPPLVSSVNPYPRRRPQERIIPKCRTELYRKSFFPSTTYLWNDLPPHVQQYQSIGQLKNYLRSADSVVPPYYYSGNRKEQIIHCKLRLSISDLNFDLCLRHLSQDPSCTCRFPEETAEHFLLNCPKFANQRLNTIHSLPVEQQNIHTLLCGNDTLSLNDNESIFRAVEDFIALTQRFKS